MSESLPLTLQKWFFMEDTVCLTKVIKLTVNIKL